MRRSAAYLALVAMLAVAATPASAAPRSLKIDTFEPPSPWEAGILDGLTLSDSTASRADLSGLLFGDFMFSGFAPVYDDAFGGVLSAGRRGRSCDRALDVAGPNAYFNYAEITGLLGSGETVDVGRCTFFDQYRLDDIFSVTGATAFQWAFFVFDDAVIAGLYGPVERIGDNETVFRSITDDTTFLRDERTGERVGGATAGFTENYLCFSRDGATFNGSFAGGDLGQCRGGTHEVPEPGTLGLLGAGLLGLWASRRRTRA